MVSHSESLGQLSQLVPLHGVRAVAFDADDTLWALQNHFEDVEREYCALLAEYGDSAAVSAALFATESANMPDLGYGCKAFIISLVENAINVSHGRVESAVLAKVLQLGRRLLHVSAEPLEGVAGTLRQLHGLRDSSGRRRYKLAVFTKGELLDQENKLRRSGLKPYFDLVRVVSDKTRVAYAELCDSMQVEPSQLLMVGNSFKSDIAPALEIGAYAAHIPFHTLWAHEATDEYEHERLFRLERFEDVARLLY